MVFLWFFLIVLLFILAAGYYGYHRVFFSPQKGRDRIPDFSSSRYDENREKILSIVNRLVERPCEYVTIHSRDGLVLSGRYYHVQDGAPLDIGFHGYRSSPMTDFSGGSALSFELGHNLLLVDQRSHGKSEGRTITFGIQERYDVLSWVDYTLERFGADTQIVLYGISMGASTVIMASALELPSNVRCVIADCPYSSPKEIICHVMESLNMPSRLLWPFIRLGGRLYGGFNATETSAALCARETRVPILILHGEADTFVPCSMSADIAQANPAMVSVHTFPRADHGLSFLVDSPRYRSLVIAFLEKAL